MRGNLFPASGHDVASWRALGFFAGYRVVIATIFTALSLLPELPEPLGIFHPDLFQLVAWMYLAAAIVLLVSLYLQIPRFPYQVAAQVAIDITAITLIIFSSAGIGSGMGMLLIVSIACGGLLLPGRIAYLFAAIATIAILGEELYSQLVRFYPPPNYTHAAALGIIFFITAFISHMLAIRVRESEALAARRAVDLENLSRLNEHIVQHMQSGIIVLDANDRIRLLNTSARNLLGMIDTSEGKNLQDTCPELAMLLGRWRDNPQLQPDVIQPQQAETDIQVSFRGLREGETGGALVFLEDASQLRQRAQHMKLASLGRMAASIAHEVRNPLGAISHAGQLLSESSQLGQADRRLTDIIQDHSRRVNAIIENVMRISRREPATPQSLLLRQWLLDFAEDFRSQSGLEPGAIRVSVEPADMMVMIDPSQLQQVLWNLCENAVRYSRSLPLVALIARVRAESGRPYLDIMDTGTGMPARVEQHLFEPFTTSASNGTGLGLYIARELCEANQATLSLYRSTETGCQFRISFPHTIRHHVVQ